MKQVIFTTITLVAMLVAVSCSKESGMNPNSNADFDAMVREAKDLPVYNTTWTPRTTKSGKIAIGVSPENPDNPFDFVGALHNEGLDYFITNYKNYPAFLRKKHGQTYASIHELFKIIADFYDSKGLGQWKRNILNPQNRANFRANLPAILDGTYRPTNVSQAFQSYTNCLLNAVAPTNVGCPFNDRTCYVQTCSADIKTMEANILANTSLAPTEKVILLCMASVGRYSTFYWNSVAADPNDPWFEIAEITDVTKMTNPDVGGAIWGAGFSIGYQLVTTGSVSLNGVVGGAVSGAVGASIGAPLAISRFIKNWWK